MSDSVRDWVDLFARKDGAKASFATKAVNRVLLGYAPRGGTRVRFSLMPRDVSRLVDVRTHPVEHRIAPSMTSSRPATRSTSTSRR